MIRQILFAVIFSVTAFAQQTKQQTPVFDLNDVSVLLPLPKMGDWNYMPSASTKAAKGVLLSKEVFELVPQLLQLATNEEVYSSLHAVGIRIDPCFAEGHGPIKCQTQIRMVWQPLSNEENDTSTFDASLHTFYQLTAEEFKSLVAELKKIKSDLNIQTDLTAPLGVNPTIKKQGYTGEYYTRLINTIYKYVGESNFSRITFMQLNMGGDVWTFGGFDIVNGKLKTIQIPKIDFSKQIFRNGANPRPIWFIGGITPEPEDAENLNILTRDSRKLSPQDEEAIIAAAKAAFKFENPKLHNPGTVDCVSCHVAQPAKIWAQRQYPWLRLDQINREIIYANDQFNLRNMSPMQIHTNIVRAFGYFMDAPIVAQRTINESAEVANYLNQNY